MIGFNSVEYIYKYNCLKKDISLYKTVERASINKHEGVFTVSFSKAELFTHRFFSFSFIDYVNGGELFTHLVQRVRFKEQEVALYSGEIVLALEHLHKVISRLNTITTSCLCQGNV